MTYYPVSLKISGLPCLVVGGGAVALRKARALVRAGARVRAVSPEFDPGFRRLEVELRRRRFSPSDVADKFLVISATDDPGVNRAVSRVCRKRNIPVNVADRPALCTFIAPALMRRGPVTIAISTEGQSPALAKAIRKDLEKRYPESVGRLALKLGAARRRVLESRPPSRTRTRLLKGLVTPRLLRKAAGR